MDPAKLAAYGDQDSEAIKKANLIKSIKNTFDVFDMETSGTVDVRELGALVRNLGVFPQESDLEKMVAECQEEPPTGFVSFEKFNTMMSRILLAHQYPRDSEDTLLRAFRVLDTEGAGFIEAERMRSLLALKGDKFTPEEIDEFIAFAADPATGTIVYDEYVTQVCAF